MDVKIKRSMTELSAWLIKYSSDFSKGCVQRSMAVIVTSGMKNPLKKLEFLQFLPRFQVLSLLFLRNSYLPKILITLIQKYCPTTYFSKFIAVTVIRDADKANQDKIAVHLFCVYLSCDRNNMKSLQWQIHFNIINPWGPTPTL